MTLCDSSILITGGTGSLGQAIVSRLIKTPAKRIVVYSRDECKQVDMARTMADPSRIVRYFIGDVRDKERLRRAFRGIDYVIHAAALKHVDKGEYDPGEFVKTNVNGAHNIIEAALDAGVKRVLAVSSDKAVNPVNLYGATKLCADKLFVAGNAYSGKDGTAFAVIRFGNFIGSRGSVLPYFEELIKNGKPCPITDVDMLRYWIPIERAVDSTLQALAMMRGGEIFVPKMDEIALIDFIKCRFPNAEIEVIGRRKGEKLREEIFCDGEKECAIESGGLWVIKN